MWEALPPMYKEIPIGKFIQAPITDFAWYRNHSADNVTLSENVKDRTKRDLFSILKAAGFGEDTIETLEVGYPQFLDNLREAMVSQNAILMRVDWPSVSKNVGHRPANQMKLFINANEVPFPIQLPDGSETYINVGVGGILATDMGAALEGTNFDLRVMGIRGLKVSPEDLNRLQRLHRKKEEGGQQAVEPTPEEQEEFEVVTDDEIIEDVTDENTTASGPIASLVKKALVREKLPTTHARVKVSGQTFHHKARFAKVLSSALRQEIDAECSVRHYRDDVEVQVSVAGSKFTALPAIYGISMYVADQFVDTTKVGVNVDVQPGLSSFGLMESDILDQSLRKIAFDQWRVQ